MSSYLKKNKTDEVPTDTYYNNSNIKNYNQPLNGFRLQKHGLWLNFLLIFLNFLVYLFIVSNIPYFRYGEGSQLGVVIFWVLVFASTLNLVPTLISHTGWKYVIFLLNVFIGPTIIGWILLLMLAIATNNGAKREQELNYLLRKVSDKLGED